jgi:predicted amidohydrolase YtcJ
LAELAAYSPCPSGKNQFDEKSKGSLEAGKLAGIVVLSRDIFNIDPVQIGDTRVDLTIFRWSRHL